MLQSPWRDKKFHLNIHVPRSHIQNKSQGVVMAGTHGDKWAVIGWGGEKVKPALFIITQDVQHEQGKRRPKNIIRGKKSSFWGFPYNDPKPPWYKGNLGDLWSHSGLTKATAKMVRVSRSLWSVKWQGVCLHPHAPRTGTELAALCRIHYDECIKIPCVRTTRSVTERSWNLSLLSLWPPVPPHKTHRTTSSGFSHRKRNL